MSRTVRLVVTLEVPDERPQGQVANGIANALCGLRDLFGTSTEAGMPYEAVEDVWTIGECPVLELEHWHHESVAENFKPFDYTTTDRQSLWERPSKLAGRR